MPLGWTLPTPTDLADVTAFVRNSVPSWFFSIERDEEEVAGVAEPCAVALGVIRGLGAEAAIRTAQGVWLDEHGRDRNVRRLQDEADDIYRERVRTVEDAVTRPAVLAAADQILEGAGVAGSSTMIELGVDGLYLGDTSLSTIQGYYGDGSTVDGNTNGYRWQATRPLIFIVILPVGATQDVVDAVYDQVRIIKGAGYGHRVEVMV